MVLGIRNLPFGHCVLQYSTRSFCWTRPMNVVDRTRRFALATDIPARIQMKRHSDAQDSLSPCVNDISRIIAGL